MTKTLKQYLSLGGLLDRRLKEKRQSILFEKLMCHILAELDQERMIMTGIGMGYKSDDPFLTVTRAANKLKQLKAYD